MTSSPRPRTVLVTGGSKGIGRGLAEHFLSRGDNVVVCARSIPDAPPESDGRRAVFLSADIRDPDQAASVVDACVDRFGRLDLTVNNAGGSPDAPADTMSPRFFSAIINLNLSAPFYVAQRSNYYMQQQDEGGVILNLGSVSGQDPAPGTAAYVAAKAGLIGLTKALALEWAPRVRVNHITVGLVRTENVRYIYGDEDSVRAVESIIPMGRLATPQDIAGAVELLASPSARYVTGADLHVHGGGELPARHVVATPIRD